MFQDHKFDEETLSKIADMMDAENDEIPPFDLDMFVRHLKELIAAPAHLKIYALARKILKHEHQRPFAERVPDLAETKLTLVIKNPDEPGFSLAGGAENGLSIFVDDVSFNLKTRKSTMNPFGKKLQIGDQILSGIVRPCGYYPVIESGKDVRWEFNGAYDYKNEITTVLIQLGSDEKHGLGVMEHVGKYVIHRIQPGAVADKIGLKVGDKIERLDGESLAKKSMHDVTIALKKKEVSFSFKTASRNELETFLEDLKSSRKATDYQKTILAIQQRIGIKPETETNDKTNFLGSNETTSKRKSIIHRAAEINNDQPNKRVVRPSVRKTVSFDQPDSAPKNWNFNPEDLARIKEKEEAKEAQKITEKEAPQLDKSLEEEVVIDSKPEKLTIAKSKTQTILERKFRENLAQHGGRGTITVPQNMRKIHKKTGEKYKIDVTDRFQVDFYLDSEGQCALKSVEWVKVKAGVDFKQTSVLPGDQILSIDGADCQGKSMFHIRTKLQDRSKEKSTEIEVFHTKRTVGDVLKHANTAVTESSPSKPSPKAEKSEKQEEAKKESTKASSAAHPSSTAADKANPVKPLATAF
ncbi:Oidioi.mRNA.OKI2018_I69.XSR.g16950.t1.cds [Oikopleura dioica]|uniref:Oidioi.mRNA.OKI2018_I69.XSR.g16950.t1.cds n=1 Tax=Oikopleura dioica TaxID=34765 RepID=A0ABN7SJI2_OIKDI|nr:Oidioi.mRNA.OKI2018_I69.XSR.g16950.t1.cds [Oikopleura dioica]